MPRTADRVKETTTTTGTGSVTLAGAATGYQTFSSAFSTNDLVWYCIAGTSEWEVGLGTLSGSTTFARTKVYSSSNSGAAVNFSAGSKDVFCTAPADLMQSAGNGRAAARAAYMAMM